MAEGQRRPRVTGYYQRNKPEEPSAKASETVGMVKPPGGARREGGTPHSQQQVEDAELEEDWEEVEHEDLKKLQAGQSGKSLSQVTPAMQEPKCECPPASSGPASTLSTDSERFSSPYSSLSESLGEHRGLETGTFLLMRLQQENAAKVDTINKLERDVNQLKKRLTYAEQLEEELLLLTTNESKLEEENQILRREVDALKRKASLSRPLTRSYAHEQKTQEVQGRYEEQYHEELEENSRLRGKISQLEKEIQGQEEGTTRIDEVDDPGLNVELRRKERHVHALKAQVESLQQYAKGQSKHVLQLKQELQAVKVTGEEIDASWRGMVDQLEEENRKQSLDVGRLYRDKKFLEKSLEAAMARNENLEPLAQKLQTELEDVIQKEESARKQLESIGGSSRKAFLKCQQLEAENKKLSEQMKKLSELSADSNALSNDLKAHIRKLEEEKEALQNEVQIAGTTAQLYSEDFASERRDREAAHSKLAQMEEDLLYHRDRLAEVEEINQRMEKEMGSVLKEASNNETEVQAKTSQVKQYKKQVDSLKDQVAELQRHNENLIQEMDRVMAEMEKLKLEVQAKTSQVKQYKMQVASLKDQVAQLMRHSEDLIQELERVRREMEKLKMGNPKIKPSDADDPSKLAELEGRNKDLLKERNKLYTELDKIKKDLAKKTKAEAEKTKKDAEKGKKKKQSDKGVTSPEPSEVSGALAETVTEKEQLRNENDALRDEVEQYQRAYEDLQTLVTHGPKNLSLAQSRARVAELEGEIAEMKTAFSDAEHQQIRAFQDLSKLITEKDTLLQAAQAERLQLTQEKDRSIQRLESEKDQLRKQLSEQIQRQSQRPHESNFWEVPRNEITLNMQKFLGTGAWGFVVEGKFRGQQVAVKCLHDLIRQPAVIEIIRKEICIMAQIRHPNLVLLIAAVIDAKNDPLIVTELLDTSLRKAYENHRLQGSKLSIFRDVASALNYLHLHQRGEIIHRDVSSANVLLEAKPNNQWKAKLSDFGSAKRAIEAKTTGPGAPAYTAPEVRKDMGIRQTGKLDVYSYGVLLCEVTVEQFPMDGSLPGMVQVVQSRWSFMHRLVTSCMQDHPDNRPAMSYVLGEFDKLRPQK